MTEDLRHQLLFAVSRWNTDRALELIERGADLNYVSPVVPNTPLLEAAQRGDGKVLRKLVEKGANVNFIQDVPPDEHARHGLGWTTCPLAAACDYNERNGGFEEEIALLKAHGARYVKKGMP